MEFDELKKNQVIQNILSLKEESLKDSLAKLDLEHVQKLKKFANEEILQHKLFVFCHEAAVELENLKLAILSLEAEISQLDPQEMCSREKQEIEEKIDAIAQSEQDFLIVMDKALVIGWNGDRIDLIDSLSEMKEKHQKFLLTLLNRADISSLYSLLDHRLYSVYGNPHNALESQAFKEEDSSIEALTKLGIWHLEDYFALGLLTEIKTVRDLHLDPSQFKEEERLEHRRRLFKKARKELETRGIMTVHDLKRESIFSKQSLLEWLQSHPKSPSSDY